MCNYACTMFIIWNLFLGLGVEDGVGGAFVRKELESSGKIYYSVHYLRRNTRKYAMHFKSYFLCLYSCHIIDKFPLDIELLSAQVWLHNAACFCIECYNLAYYAIIILILLTLSFFGGRVSISQAIFVIMAHYHLFLACHSFSSNISCYMGC